MCNRQFLALLLPLSVFVFLAGCATPNPSSPDVRPVNPELLDTNPLGSAEIKNCAKEIGPKILMSQELSESWRPVNVIIKPLKNNASFRFNSTMITNELKNELMEVASQQGSHAVRFITNEAQDIAMGNKITHAKMEAKVDALLNDVADSLLLSPAVSNASTPPVIAVVPAVNCNMVNLNADSFIAMLRAKIASKANGHVQFTMPGHLQGADYYLTGQFIAESMKNEGMVNLVDYITLMEDRLKAGKSMNLDGDLATMKIQAVPGCVTGSLTFPQYKNLLDELSRDTNLRNIPDANKHLNLMLVKVDNKITAFEKMFQLEKKSTEYLDKVDLILTGEVSSISSRINGQESMYVVVSFRLVNPEDGMEIWFGKYESKKAYQWRNGPYR